MRIRRDRSDRRSRVGIALSLLIAGVLSGCQSVEPPKIVTPEDRAIAAAHADQASGFLNDGALVEAGLAIEEALAIDPLTPEHRILAMQVYCKTALQNNDPKLYQDGVRHGDVAVASEPENITFLLERGKAQFDRRYYTRAVHDLSAALKLGSSDSESQRRLALAHRGLRQPKAERRVWESMIARHPNDGRAHYELARLLQRTAADEDEEAEALSELRRAAQLAPADAEILHALANQLAQNEDLAGAESLLLRAVSAADDPAREQDALVSLGACAQARGGLNEARGYYERAVALDPTDARALGNLGYVMGELGHRGVARRLLQDAKELEDDSGVKREIDDYLKGLRGPNDDADLDTDSDSLPGNAEASIEFDRSRRNRGHGGIPVAADDKDRAC